MAESPLVRLGAAFNRLSRPQRLGVMFSFPVIVALGSGWMAWTALGTLGPDEALPSLLKRQEAGSLVSQIDETNGQIASQEQVIARWPTVKARLKELQGDIAAAEERLPREVEKAQMRELIQRLARDIPTDIGIIDIKSVRINDTAPDAGRGAAAAKAKGPTIATVTYQCDLRGDMNGLIKFIDSVEKHQRFMSVSNITLASGGAKEDATSQTGAIAYGLHTVKLDIVTYVFTGQSGGAK